MFDELDHEFTKIFSAGVTLIAVDTSTYGNDGAVTHFGYTGGSLAETFVPANKSVDAYLRMTIHGLVEIGARRIKTLLLRDKTV